MGNIIAIVLLIVGAGCVFWGYQLSGAFTSQVSQALTGSNSDKEMILYIGGFVSFAVGVFLILKK